MKPLPLFAALLSSVLLHPSAFSQGSLIPLGPPAATFKTLQQIEPRTDLQATPAPPGVDTTNANYTFIITAPGSYYLSNNLVVTTKPNGIQIAAEGVTLDLNGFQISRTAGSGGNGIEIVGNRVRLHSGSVKGFAYGITNNGVAAPHGCLVRDVIVTGCSAIAIVAGKGWVLESCAVHDNSGTAGISASGSSISNCSAYNNSTTYGINANSSALSHCVATENKGGAETAETAGFNVTDGSVAECTSYSNSTILGTTDASHGIGFLVTRSTIQSCSAGFNRGDGIRLLGKCLARDNVCTSNGSAGDGAGINAAVGDNRIDSNHVNGNDRGIDINSTGNVIVRNTAGGNSLNYKIVVGNHYAPIIDDTDETAANAPAASGNSATGDLNSNHPWANFAY